MDTRTVIFIGPQGSGKGTQIEKLKTILEDRDRRRVVDIQTGRRFRSLAAKQETSSARLFGVCPMGSGDGGSARSKESSLG